MLGKITIGIGLTLFVVNLQAQKPSFEVASIKPNMSTSAGGGLGPRADRLVATNMSLKSLMNYAYSTPNSQLLASQIVGGPGWTDTDRFDVEAKFGGTARPSIDQIRVMLQSLLEERFQLKVHREVRDLPVFNLVGFKDGPKLSLDQTPPDRAQSFINFSSTNEQLAPLPRGAMRMITGPTSTRLVGSAIPVSNVVMLLQGRTDRIIVDKTSLAGLIDINLEFSPETSAAGANDVSATNPSSPSLFTAIQELGLKLESAKAPMEVIVVESAQKPSEN